MAFTVTANTSTGFGITLGGSSTKNVTTTCSIVVATSSNGLSRKVNVTTTQAITLNTGGLLTNIIKYNVTTNQSIVSFTNTNVDDTAGRIKYANGETNNLSQFDNIADAGNIVASTDSKLHGTYGFKIPFNGTIISQAVDFTFTGRTGSNNYSRMYIYVPSGYTFGSGISWIHQGVTSIWGSTISVGIVTTAGVPTAWRVQVASNYIDVALDLDVWNCIELRHEVNGTSSGGQFWLNGVLEYTNYGEDVGAGTLDRIRFGFEQGSAPQNGAYIYFDDCVVDDSYIGAHFTGSLLNVKKNVTETCNIELSTGTPPPQNLLTNSFDWTDSDSDGIADGWQRNYGTENCSIVTGNGFSGNAQRMVATTGGAAQAMSCTSFTFVTGQAYLLRLKYRCSAQLLVLEGVQNQVTAFPANTGNARVAEFTFYPKLTNQGLNFFVYDNAEWFEIDEVELFEISQTTGVNIIPSASSNFNTDGTGFWSSLTRFTQSWDSVEGAMKLVSTDETSGWNIVGADGILEEFTSYKVSFKAKISGTYNYRPAISWGTDYIEVTGPVLSNSWQNYSYVIHTDQYYTNVIFGLAYPPIGSEFFIDDIIIEKFTGLERNIVPLASSDFNTDGTSFWEHVGSNGATTWNSNGWIHFTGEDDYMGRNGIVDSTNIGKMFNISLKVRSADSTRSVRINWGGSEVNLGSMSTEWQTLSANILCESTTMTILVSLLGTTSLDMDDIVIKEVYIPTQANLNVKKNVTETCNLSSATVGLLNRKFNAVTQNDIVLYTIGILELPVASIKNVITTQSIILATSSAGLDRKINVSETCSLTLSTTSNGLNRKINVTSTQAITSTTSSNGLSRKVNITETSSMVLNTVSLVNVKKALSGTSVIVFSTAPPLLGNILTKTVTTNLVFNTTAVLINKKFVTTTQGISLNTIASQILGYYYRTVNTAISLNTTAIVTVKKNITTTNAIALNTISDKILTYRSNTATANIVFNTTAIQKRLFNTNLVKNVVFNTTSILTNKVNFTATVNIQSNTDAIIKRKTNSISTQAIVLNTVATELFATLNKQITINQSITFNTTSTLSRNVLFTTTQEITSNTAAIQTRKINVVNTTALVGSTVGLLNLKKAVTNTVNIVFNTVTVDLHRKHNFITTDSLVFNTTAIQIRKINVVETNNIVLQTDAIQTRKISITQVNNIVFSTLNIPVLIVPKNIITTNILQGFTTSNGINRKVAIAETVSLVFNTTAIQKKLVSFITSNTLTLNTTAIINRRVTIVEISSLTFNTTGIQKRLFNISENNSLVLNTTSILSTNRLITASSNITSLLTQVLNYKVNSVSTSSIVFNTASFELFTTNSKPLSTVQSISFNTSNTILYRNVLSASTQNLVSNTVGTQVKTIRPILTTLSIVSNTTGDHVSVYKHFITTQNLITLVAGTQVKTTLGVISSQSLTLTTIGSLNRKVTIISPLNIVSFTTGTQVKTKINDVITNAISLNTVANITRKITVVTNINNTFFTSANINLKKTVTNLTNLVVLTSANILSVKLQNTSNISIAFNTVTFELFVSLSKYVSLSTSLAFNTTANLARNVKFTSSDLLSLNTTGILINKYFFVDTTSLALNTTAIISRKVTVSELINISSNTTGILINKKIGTATSTITLNTSPVELFVLTAKYVTTSNNTVLSTQAVLTRTVGVGFSSSIVLNTGAVLVRYVTNLTQQDIVLSTVSDKFNIHSVLTLNNNITLETISTLSQVIPVVESNIINLDTLGDLNNFLFIIKDIINLNSTFTFDVNLASPVTTFIHAKSIKISEGIELTSNVTNYLDLDSNFTLKLELESTII